jgi:hypothetical protein
VKVLKDGAEFVFVPIVGQNIVGMIFKVFKFAIKALSALASELFNLSEKTRGSLLLILIFFYSAFVLGSLLLLLVLVVLVLLLLLILVLR